MERIYSVYIMSNATDKVLYIGVTNDLARRVREHQLGLVEGFTKKYQVVKLVYHEETDDIYGALEREKQLKGWVRRKKDWLINQVNPERRDLSFNLYREDEDPSAGSG